MKITFLLFGASLLTVAGCQSNSGSLEKRANIDRAYPNQEPYSKEQRETIDEPAGAQNQAREGEENPFIQPKAGQTHRIFPQQPMPPPSP